MFIEMLIDKIYVYKCYIFIEVNDFRRLQMAERKARSARQQEKWENKAAPHKKANKGRHRKEYTSACFKKYMLCRRCIYIYIYITASRS